MHAVTLHLVIKVTKDILQLCEIVFKQNAQNRDIQRDKVG